LTGFLDLSGPTVWPDVSFNVENNPFLTGKKIPTQQPN